MFYSTHNHALYFNVVFQYFVRFHLTSIAKMLLASDFANLMSASLQITRRLAR